jgi:ssDNA-specific exonuclease RecJ
MNSNPKEFHKIFTELGFTYVDDGCDGYCPECEKKDDCKVYLELKDD